MAGQGRPLQSAWLESGIPFERLYTANGSEAAPVDTAVWGDWFFEAAAPAGPTGTFDATLRRATMAFAGDITGVAGVLGITTRRAYMDFTGEVTGAIGQFAATTRRNTMQFGEAVAAATRRRILRLRNFLRVGR